GGRYVYRDYTYTASGSGGTSASPGPASIIAPAGGSTLAGATQTFQWNDAGASLYQLWLGNSPGTYDIGYFPASGTTSTSVTAIGIPTDGRKVYARLYSNVNGSYAYRDFAYTASGSGAASAPPSAATITSPVPGATLAGTSATFAWNDSGASLYQLWVGTSPGAFDVGYFPAAGTTAQSVTATGLPTDGRKLYVRLNSAVNGTWQYRDFAYTAAGSGSGGTSTPGPASMLTPASGSTLPGTSVTFTWTDANASLYQLWIGTSPGAFDIGYYPARGTTQTSTTVSGLPAGGRTLYVRLYSAIGGNWQFRDYTYLAPP
ncbi:MAG TPA: hypothetical protein VFU81_05795, partial [Thermomicrobiales bacterium]|nr:hypothetical protein [Thermomicrobiales bacterium]